MAEDMLACEVSVELRTRAMPGRATKHPTVDAVHVEPAVSDLRWQEGLDAAVFKKAGHDDASRIARILYVMYACVEC